jgi:hypothetical protein
MAGPEVVLIMQEAMAMVVPTHQTMDLVVVVVDGVRQEETILTLFPELILVEQVAKLST